MPCLFCDTIQKGQEILQIMAEPKTEQKPDFLLGVEIRTMKKDIARLQLETTSNRKDRGERLRFQEVERKKLEEELRQREIELERKLNEIHQKANQEQKAKEDEKTQIEKEKAYLEAEKSKIEEQKKSSQESLQKKEEAIKQSQEQFAKNEEAKLRLAEEIIKREEARKKMMDEEAIKRQEEAQKKKTREEVLEEEKTAVKRERIEIQKQLQIILEKKRPFDLKKTELLKELEPIEKAMEVIGKRESLIEDELQRIEDREKAADSEQEKKEIENQRWGIEEKRRQVEKERWPWDEERNKIEKKIGEVELQYREIIKNEDLLKEKENELVKKEEKINAEKEKIILQKELSQLYDNKKSLTVKKEDFFVKSRELEDVLRIVMEKERKIEEDKKLIEEEQKLVKNVDERRKLEKERWDTEEKRRKIEQERWRMVEDKRKIDLQIKRIDLTLQRILERENEIKSQLKNIEDVISPAEIKTTAPPEKPRPETKATTPAPAPTPATAPALPKEAAPVSEEEQQILEAKRRIEEARKRIEASRKIEEKEKMEESFKGREIKEKPPAYFKLPQAEEKQKVVEPEKPAPIPTPKKEEGQGDIEWQKLEKGWAELDEERREFVRRASQEKITTKKEEKTSNVFSGGPQTIIRPLPKKPSFKERLGIRIIIFLSLLIILALIVSFLYWFFKIRKDTIPEPNNGGQNTPATSTPPDKPIILLPEPLINVDRTFEPEIDSNENLPNAVLGILQQNLIKNQVNRIAVKNVTEKRMVNLSDFATAFNIKTPTGLLQKLENDYTLFAYSLENKNRLGFVAKIKEGNNVSASLLTWEKTMKADMQPLLSFLGQTGTSSVKTFKKATYQNVSFRYLTISKDDFGLCYAVINNYFVFTTSYESMKIVIDRIKAQTAFFEKNLGQLFIIGFKGKTVTPELAALFKKYHPGGVLLLAKNIESEDQLKKLTSDLQELSIKETGLPLFISVDQEGGDVSRIGFLEEKTPQSEIETPEQAFLIGKKRGEELKALGINLNFSPVLDSGENGDFLFGRTFQKNSYQVGDLAKSLILGQKSAGVLSTIKHFPGYGGIAFNPEEKLGTTEILPEISQFKTVQEIDPEFVMVANVIYNEIDPSLPFSFSPKGIEFLKSNLGENIIVITDDLDQNALLKKYSLKEVVVKPVVAGSDLLIFSGWRSPVQNGLDEFILAFKRQEVTPQMLQKKIDKIIKIKQEYLTGKKVPLTSLNAPY